MRVLPRVCAVTAVALTALLPSAASATSASSQSPAQLAAGYIARALLANGGHIDYPASFGGGVDYGSTVNGVLALEANGVGWKAVHTATPYLKKHVNAYVKDSNGADRPGALGELLLVAHATQNNVHDFGGTDLVHRLLATETATGLFGVQDATYDGAYRQSLAILGLVAAGVRPNTKAIAWLYHQQCTSGAWQADRADTAKPCSDPDSNSTAAAMQALIAAKAKPRYAAAVALRKFQGSDGGFADTNVKEGSDSNSTALAMQAYIAADRDPASITRSGHSPEQFLASVQLGCSSASNQRGALDFQPEKTLHANDFATVQAAQALAGSPMIVTPRSLGSREPQMTCPTG